MNPTGPIGQEEWLKLEQSKKEVFNYNNITTSYTDKEIYELDRLLIICLCLQLLDLPFSPRLQEKLSDIENEWFQYIIERILIDSKYSRLIKLTESALLKVAVREYDIFQMLKTLDDKMALELFMLMYKEAMFYKHKKD